MENNLVLCRIQNDYLELLNKYRQIISDQTLTTKTIAVILDEISIFWLKRLEIVQYELDRLASHNQCFLLSGAMYLGIDNNEHYYFKSLGDYHILFDPLLKTEVFIRASDKVDIQEIIRIFITAYTDTLKILSYYPNCFLILPIQQIAWTGKDEMLNILDGFFWQFMTSIFNTEFTNSEDFCKIFVSLEAIESKIDTFAINHLIFTDFEDIHFSLENRVKRYCESQPIFAAMSKEMSQAEMFLMLIYNQISQIIDILLTCTTMQLIPFIRLNTTFNYLLLLMYSFVDDSSLRSMIEKTIIFYVFYKSTDINVFNEINFEDYCNKLKEYNLLNNITTRVNNSKLDIFKEGFKELEKIVHEEFTKVIR